MATKFYNLDTDSTFSANSDYLIASQKAIKTALDTKADSSNVYDKDDADKLLSSKQDILTPGDGISIEDNVISASVIVATIKDWTK